MRPYIVCHMMSSLDGRIDCAMTEQLGPDEPYYETMASFGCNSMLMGRVTMQMHYAASEQYQAADPAPVGHTEIYRADGAESFLVAVDTMGRLAWDHNEFDGQKLLVVVSELCAREYLDYLKERNISYIACGKQNIDLGKVCEILYESFGIRRLLLTGGGSINGAFLQEKLIDELSLIIGPGIDGRAGEASVFDGLSAQDKKVTLCHLESVQKLQHDMVWLRYKF